MEKQQGDHAADVLLSCLTLKEHDGVALVTFDDQSAKVNTLNSKLIPQFETVLAHIESSSTIKSVVIASGKASCFIAGADISELQACTDVEQAKKLSSAGQNLFSRLQSLSQPVVAAIHGTCLGGGLELALACDYRIATRHSSTTLGLPEVMLGLLPGAGGTQRLPKLVGLEQAIKMMMTGAHVRAEKAKKIGLVDLLVYPDGLLEKAVQFASKLSQGKKTSKAVPGKGFVGFISKFKSGKHFVLSKALEQVHKKTRGLYPAPIAIIDVLKYSVDHPTKGYEKEAEEFARLSQTTECKALISLYFAQTELKKNLYGTPEVPAQNLAVLGAGLMGAGISLISLQKNFMVRLRDIGVEQLARGKKYIWGALAKRIKRKSMSQFEAEKVFSKLYSQTDFKNFNECQLVIEAVFEDLQLKHKVLKEVEEHSSENMIFASNTSALPITDIAKASKRPQRVIGMHYFSPVEKMPLLEIIVTKDTSKEVISVAVDVGIRQGKTVIVVGDGPGFYTTRILAPFMDEVSHLALEGVDFYTLDDAMKDFGYPVGPIALIDEVGIDVAFHVADSLGKSLGERVSSQDPTMLQSLIDKGAKGRKSGKGFYIYDDPKQKKSKPGSKKAINKDVVDFINKAGKKSVKPIEYEDIQKRMCLRMVNEAAYCLHEGILQTPRDGDIGAVFGLGFPPFLGGPFRYCDQVGVATIVNDLKVYQSEFGDRFKPAPNLVEMAQGHKKFFPS